MPWAKEEYAEGKSQFIGCNKTVRKVEPRKKREYIKDTPKKKRIEKI